MVSVVDTMSSSQIQMESAKEVPKKVSAKEKFAAAQSAKAAAKAAVEEAAAKKEAAKMVEKAKHDAAFEKEKKKVAKKVEASAHFEAECRAEFSAMSKEQRATKLGELRVQLKEANRKQAMVRVELNDESSAVGKEAAAIGRLAMRIGILEAMI